MIRTETVTKTVREYVPIPDDLTETLAGPEIPEEQMTWRQIADLALQYRAMVETYESRMNQIKAIGEQDGLD